MKEKNIIFWNNIREKKLQVILYALSFVLIAFVLFWTTKRVYNRCVYEKLNNNVEVAVKIDEAKRICDKERYKIENLLERIKTIGVSSVIIEEETIDSLSDKNKIMFFPRVEVEKYKMLGFVSPETLIIPDCILVKNNRLAVYLQSTIKGKTGKPLQGESASLYRMFKVTRDIRDIGWGYVEESADFARKYGLNIILKPYQSFWIPESPPEKLSCLLLIDTFDEALVEVLKSRYIRVALEEFSKEEKRYKRLLAPGSEEVVRLYRIFPEKPPEPSIPVLESISKAIKAARERNCRIIYFDFIDNLSLEQNLDYLRILCNKLKKSGFTLDQSRTPSFMEWWGLPDIINKLLGLLISVLFPLISVYFIKLSVMDKNKPVKDIVLKFCLVCLINIAGGLFIAVLFTDLKYFLKLDEFRGIKLSIILPILLAIPVFFNFKELKEFCRRPTNFGNILLFFMIVFIIVLLVARSGNISFVSSIEAKLRLLLEDSFGIRPRFKEFLVGHPLLILGMVFNSRILVILGLIGQISIINTFEHFHTPLYITVLRVIYGIIIGLLIGLIAVVIAKTEFIKRIKTNLFE